VGAVALRALDRPGDLGWVVERHGALYGLEFGWDQSFEALVAGIVADFEPGPREAGWMAEVDGRRVGCVLCTASPLEGVAKLRALLVEPEARGLGVGRLLAERCIEFARDAGYTRIELWTTANLEAAGRLYEALGFRVVREEREEAFGAELLSRHMELELGQGAGSESTVTRPS
jgi:GNAT superfamily N-acetyltransferase